MISYNHDTESIIFCFQFLLHLCSRCQQEETERREKEEQRKREESERRRRRQVREEATLRDKLIRSVQHLEQRREQLQRQLRGKGREGRRESRSLDAPLPSAVVLPRKC